MHSSTYDRKVHGAPGSRQGTAKQKGKGMLMLISKLSGVSIKVTIGLKDGSSNTGLIKKVDNSLVTMVSSTSQEEIFFLVDQVSYLKK